MASVRQERIAKVLQQELSKIFLAETKGLCLGSMVSVTIVRVTSDLSSARVYLSIFAAQTDESEVLDNIKLNSKIIKHNLSQITKGQLRRIPELHFYVDDSMDYAEQINELLKK